MTTIKRMGKRETQNGCCCPGCPGGAPMAMRVFHSFKLINFFRTGKSRGRTAFGKCFKSKASGFSERMSRILLVDRGGRQYLLRQVFVNRIANPYGQAALLTRPWDRTQFAKSRFALGRGASEGVYPARSRPGEQGSPRAKRPWPGGLRRFWLVASLLVGLQSAAAMLSSSRLATSQNRLQ